MPRNFVVKNSDYKNLFILFLIGGYLSVEIGVSNDRVGYVTTPRTKSNTEACLTFFYRVGNFVHSRTAVNNSLHVLMSETNEVLVGKELWWSNVST